MPSPSNCEFVLMWCKQFLLVTGQHGYKYLVLPRQIFFEKVIWTATILVATGSAIYLLWLANAYSYANPILTVVETSHYPIWNIYFPAVTICSPNKVYRPAAVNFVNNIVLPSGQSADQVLHDLASLIHLIDPTNTDQDSATRLQRVLDINNLTTETVSKKLMPPCKSIVAKCKFKGRLEECDSLFQVVKTSYGFCCGFNYYATKQTLRRYGSRNGFQDQPYLTSACGYQMGLSVLLHNQEQDYFTTLLASYGYKLLIHKPHDYPGDMTNERFIPAGGETLISLYPSVYYTTREANFVSPERRGCILTEERSVQTTVKYTFNNCFVECRQNYTFELCGCSPYYYPSSGGYRICNMSDITCLASQKYKIDATCPKFGKRYLPDAGVDVPCDCLPECTDVTYEVDMSESFITKNFSSSLHDVNDGVDSKNHSILHVYFMDLVGTRYRRDVYYNWHKLLASFGGILGLFLGFSMMTGFEMVYHFTVRVFFYLLSSRRSSADTSSSYVPPTSFRERSGLRSTRGNILGTFNETASYWPPQVTTLQENNLSYPRVTAGNEIPSTSAGTFEFNKPSSAKRSKLSKTKKTASAAHLSIITE